MAKWASTLVLDAPWTFLRKNARRLVVLSATVSTVDFSGAGAGTALAFRALTSADFTISNDSTFGGRKITLSSQTTIPVQTTGVARYIALGSSALTGAAVSTGLFYITSCATQALTSTNNAVTTPAFSLTFAGPT